MRSDGIVEKWSRGGARMIITYKERGGVVYKSGKEADFVVVQVDQRPASLIIRGKL